MFPGEFKACWEGYYNLFKEVVEPSPLETFNHLLDKLLAPGIGRADPALGLRPVLETSSTPCGAVFQISITSILTQSCWRAPEQQSPCKQKVTTSHCSSLLHGVPFHILPPPCSASRAGALILRVYSVINSGDAPPPVLILTFPQPQKIGAAILSKVMETGSLRGPKPDPLTAES